jgi:hypothetical protein
VFRLIEPSSRQIQNIVLVQSVSAHYGIPYCLQNYIDLQDHSVCTHWMYQYYGFGLMMTQWAETCRRIFNFLVLITNTCCVIDEINLLYYRKTQWDGSYHTYFTALYSRQDECCLLFLYAGLKHKSFVSLLFLFWRKGSFCGTMSTVHTRVCQLPADF